MRTHIQNTLPQACLLALSLFIQDLGHLFCPKKLSVDAILLNKYKKNRPEKAFREVVSTREVYGKK